MSRMKSNEITNILKLLSDPSRFKILSLLNENPGQSTLCVNEIAGKVDITPSAVSHQLAKMELAGLVTPIRKGQTVCYVLTDSDEVEAIRTIMEILNI